MAIFPSALLSLRAAMQFVVTELRITTIYVSYESDGAIVVPKRTKRYRALTKWVFLMVRAKGSTGGLHLDPLHGSPDEPNNWPEAQGSLSQTCVFHYEIVHTICFGQRDLCGDT